jgi:hypothetical protein
VAKDNSVPPEEETEADHAVAEHGGFTRWQGWVAPFVLFAVGTIVWIGWYGQIITNNTKRLDRLEDVVLGLPVVDEKLNGRITAIEANIARLDTEDMKKLTDGIEFEQRVSKLETALAALQAQESRLRADVNSHAADDVALLRDRLKALQDQLDARPSIQR